MSAKLLLTLFLCLKIRNGIAISGGEDAPSNIAPYRVSLKLTDESGKETHYAEASILTTNKMITSASAVHGYTAKDLTVVVGEGSTVSGGNNGNKVPLYVENIISRFTICLGRNVKSIHYDDNGQNPTIKYVRGSEYLSGYFLCRQALKGLPPAAEQRYEIDTIISHEDFDPGTYRNDIAVIYIKGRMVFGSNIKPIGIGALPRQAGDEVLIVGDGNIDNYGTRPEKLQMITATITSQEECNNKNSTEMNLCVKFERKDQGLCLHDGGAGLVIDNQVVGLSSFGTLCGEPHLFSSVVYFFDWIALH